MGSDERAANGRGTTAPRSAEGTQRPDWLRPARSAIWPASVYACRDVDHARELMAGGTGYIYQRDGHPNAEFLAERCRALHGAPAGAVTSSGMAATALALVATLEPGSHVILSDQLYGKTNTLVAQEAARWGIASTVVSIERPDTVIAAWRPNTRWVLVETISNPLLRVADLPTLAAVAHERGALLVVDNTLASPELCRPLEWGADLVIESLTKMMNGHSDVILGLVCGPEALAERLRTLRSTWGWNPSPFDSWLAERGLGTLEVRMAQACRTAALVADVLAASPRVARVWYPGRRDHPDHELARRMFAAEGEPTGATAPLGNMVTFELAGGTDAANTLIGRLGERIPFLPSLGDLTTSLSHPASTSHWRMPAAEQARLGITGGTIRLSVGIEPPHQVCSAVEQGLAGLDS